MYYYVELLHSLSQRRVGDTLDGMDGLLQAVICPRCEGFVAPPHISRMGVNQKGKALGRNGGVLMLAFEHRAGHVVYPSWRK